MVFLVQPKIGNGKDLVARALKASFFKAMLNSSKRTQRGGKMPLVGYVTGECPLRRRRSGLVGEAPRSRDMALPDPSSSPASQ